MRFTNSDKTRLKTQYGPWAFVSGASSGIGRALATQLAEAGFNLALNARREGELTQLAAALQNKSGIQTRVIPGDITDPSVMERLLSETSSLDIGLLAPCAGFGTSGVFITSDLETEVNMLRLNCEAMLRLVHHFSRRFTNRKRSGMILMSSIVAFQGVPYSAHYAATKAWVQSLAEALAIELSPQGTDVLAAIPGPVKSGFSARANMKMSLFNTPEEIAVPILKALGKTRSVVPGGVGKLLVNALRMAPRRAKTLIMKGVMGGMTAHQRTAS